MSNVHSLESIFFVVVVVWDKSEKFPDSVNADKIKLSKIKTFFTTASVISSFAKKIDDDSDCYSYYDDITCLKENDFFLILEIFSLNENGFEKK